ncbi:MAG TPA: methyltransferase domain-containing protein [Streptosporangiaceae bacterium]
MSGIRESVGSNVAELSPDRLERHRTAVHGVTNHGVTNQGAANHAVANHGVANHGDAASRPMLASVAAETVAAEPILAGRAATMTDVRPDRFDAQLFTRAALDYAAHRPGQTLVLLQAGCTTADDELDLGRLRVTGSDLAVGLVDDDSRITRAAVLAQPSLAGSTLGDLRTVSLPPRSFDIVHCALLLHRISNAELMLDRFVEALKPGGLLLVQLVDRECAVGFLDRVLPRPLRAMVWRSLRPGAPGPYRAVYEQVVSARGIQHYVLQRGLVIAQRQALDLLTGARRPPGLLMMRGLVSRLSRGRLTAGHDELRYVIRKPESGFARVL